MKDNIKNIIVTVSFFVIICGLMLANIIMPDLEFSFSERRKLKAIPEYSAKKLFSGELFEEFEKYSLDQFVLRDRFRSLKVFSTFYLFNQRDYNNIYIVDGSINKMVYPLNENSVLNAANKLNEVYGKYLQGMNVGYAIIPDKNYFVAAKNGYLAMDYDKMVEIMRENVDDMKYIDLFGCLSFGDYYKTDIHWRQDRIINVADRILKEMSSDTCLKDVQYIKRELYPFYGGFYGQVPLKLEHGKSMNPSPANTLTREFFKMPFQHLIFRQENHFLRNAPGITKIWRVKRPRLPLSIACSCPC